MPVSQPYTRIRKEIGPEYHDVEGRSDSDENDSRNDLAPELLPNVIICKMQVQNYNRKNGTHTGDHLPGQLIHITVGYIHRCLKGREIDPLQRDRPELQNKAVGHAPHQEQYVSEYHTHGD